VRETLQWLDDATSKYPHAVTLQGADETYEKWAEVEKFVVPRTLFSENDAIDEMDIEQPDEAASADMVSKLTLDDVTRKTPASSAASHATRSLSPSSMRSQQSSLSAHSPPTSPIKEQSSPAKPVMAFDERPSSSGSNSVPLRLQPLFNYILWRIHQEVDPIAALESFIFLCNDPSKVHYAKGFEVKTKRLEQLRDAIHREDQDCKNRMNQAKKENQKEAALASPAAVVPPATIASPTKDDDDDDSEVIYKPPPRGPAAMMANKQKTPHANVLDPDAFARNPSAVKTQPRSPQPQHASVHTNNGAPAVPFAPRGSPRGNLRGSMRGRGNFGGPAMRGTLRMDGTMPNGQIDPNSFSRPRGSGYTGRGGRKLWVPT